MAQKAPKRARSKKTSERSLKTIQQPNPEGRPTKYELGYCQKLIDHMAGGLSFESFAGEIGVHRDTLYEWEKVHPEFSDAKKIGTDASLLKWEKIGRDNIINSSESSPGFGGSARSINSAVWIFNMKNRFKWRDKQEGESDVVVNNFASLSDADLEAKIKAKMAKLKEEK